MPVEFVDSKILVYLGRHDKGKGGEEFEVANKSIPGQYNRKEKHHDIGLLRLDRDIVFSPHIVPACLPKFSSDGAKPGEKYVFYRLGLNLNY